MTKPDAGKFTGARIAKHRRLTPFEVKRVAEMRDELLDFPLGQFKPGPFRYERKTSLPEMKWRQATPEEAAIYDAAHAITNASQRGPEQGRFGYFRGMIIITHPDMPPHVWDGKQMHRIDSKED